MKRKKVRWTRLLPILLAIIIISIISTYILIYNLTPNSKCCPTHKEMLGFVIDNIEDNNIIFYNPIINTNVGEKNTAFFYVKNPKNEIINITTSIRCKFISDGKTKTPCNNQGVDSTIFLNSYLQAGYSTLGRIDIQTAQDAIQGSYEMEIVFFDKEETIVLGRFQVNVGKKFHGEKKDVCPLINRECNYYILANSNQ